MGRRTRFHSDRDELLPLKSWPFVPLALVQRFRPPRESTPWFNHRATKFLDAIIEPTSRILEIGAGGSTGWYAKRAMAVDSIEGKLDWYEKVLIDTAHFSNVKITYVPESGIPEYLRSLQGNYDIVVIDALLASDRVAATKTIMELYPDATIVVDDQDWVAHRPIDDLMSGWHVRRFPGMKSRPFCVFETNFFRRSEF